MALGHKLMMRDPNGSDQLTPTLVWKAFKVKQKERISVLKKSNVKINLWKKVFHNSSLENSSWKIPDSSLLASVDSSWKFWIPGLFVCLPQRHFAKKFELVVWARFNLDTWVTQAWQAKFFSTRHAGWMDGWPDAWEQKNTVSSTRADQRLTFESHEEKIANLVNLFQDKHFSNHHPKQRDELLVSPSSSYGQGQNFNHFWWFSGTNERLKS